MADNGNTQSQRPKAKSQSDQSYPESSRGKHTDTASYTQALEQINNYNGTIEIFSGLSNGELTRATVTNSASVQRLTQTWELLSENAERKWRELSDLMQNNHKLLRERMRQLSPPCIPFLGLFLTDLTFIGYLLLLSH